MNIIESAIARLEARQSELADRITEIHKAIEVLRDVDKQENKASPTAEASPKALASERRSRQARGTNRKKQAAKARGNTGGPRKQFSQYKGVYKGPNKADGRQTCQAGVWRDGKNKNLGNYLIEEQAAAVAAEARGEKAEAKRLLEIAKQKERNIAEQQENNPDRPVGRRGSRESPTTAYQCSKCGDVYSTKPPSCPGCSGASFREVQTDG